MYSAYSARRKAKMAWHITRSYVKLLKQGFGGIRQQASRQGPWAYLARPWTKR